MAKPLVLPEPFSGDGSWEDWSDHFENVAAVNKWDDAAKLLWLRVRLTGKAQTAYKNLPLEARNDYKASLTALKELFEPDSKQQLYLAEFQTRRRKQTEGWADFGILSSTKSSCMLGRWIRRYWRHWRGERCYCCRSYSARYDDGNATTPDGSNGEAGNPAEVDPATTITSARWGSRRGAAGRKTSSRLLELWTRGPLFQGLRIAKQSGKLESSAAVSRAVDGEAVARKPMPVGHTTALHLMVFLGDSPVSFLLDTGASVSLLQKEVWDRTRPSGQLEPWTGPRLVGVEGSPLTVHGVNKLTLLIDGTPFEHNLVIVGKLSTEALIFFHCRTAHWM